MNNINEIKVTFTSDKMTTILQGEKIVIEGKELNNLITGHTSLTIELLKSEKRLTEEVPDLPEKKEKKKYRSYFMARIEQNDYDLLMGAAGKTKMESVRRAQLRVIYTVLYIFRLALSEISQLTKKDLILAIQTGELNTFDPITNVGITHTLSENGTKILTKLAPEIELIFDFYGFQFLGNSKSFSDKTWSATNFMRFVNEDMKTTCIKYQLRKLNHNSFRIGDISELIKQKKPEQNIHKIEKEKEEKTKRMFDPS
jgi:hypothetical protein